MAPGEDTEWPNISKCSFFQALTLCQISCFPPKTQDWLAMPPHYTSRLLIIHRFTFYLLQHPSSSLTILHHPSSSFIILSHLLSYYVPHKVLHQFIAYLLSSLINWLIHLTYYHLLFIYYHIYLFVLLLHVVTIYIA